MHSCLDVLPQPLLNHLGAFSGLNSLAELPQVTCPKTALCQHASGEPYHVTIDGHGLTLTLQCINPQAVPEERKWGLQGFTLDAAIWSGAWPTDLNPQKATAEHVMDLFAPNPEEVLKMHPMLCFSIEGIAGQTWSVMAVFDPESKILSSLGLIHVGEWRELPI